MNNSLLKQQLPLDAKHLRFVKALAAALHRCERRFHQGERFLNLSGFAIGLRQQSTMPRKMKQVSGNGGSRFTRP